MSSGTTRREILGGGVALIGALGTPGLARAQGSSPVKSARFAYVGCRTTKERNARGEGIQVYRVDPGTGDWTHVQLLKDLVNPSFLAFDKSQAFLYAVHGDMSEISSFSVFKDTGEIKLLNRQSTQGKNPAHLIVDDSNRFVIVANYATGTLAVLPRNLDGSLGTVQQLEILPGTPGPHKSDQGFSHPHHVVYDRSHEFLAIPDKGLDRIFSYRFDSATGKLLPAPSPYVQVRPGAGPRHMAFHPIAPVAFVAHELDSSVGVYRYDGARGALTPIQIVPSIPDTHTGPNTAAEIEVSASGGFVYVSNRGHDSIGVFSVDPSSGRLMPVEWVSTEGQGPRFFTIDPSGKWLYAANEGTDTIVPFQVQSGSGRLVRVNQAIRTGSPVCVVLST